MSKYALVELGIVKEIVETDLDVREIFHPDILLIPVTEAPEVGSSASESGGNWSFMPPQPQVLSLAEIVAQNERTREYLLETATLAIAPLQDAVDLDDASDIDLASLKKWKQYRVSVSRIDLTKETPGWPDPPH